LDEAQENDRKKIILQRFVTKSLSKAHKSQVAISQEQFADISLQEIICS